MLPDDPRHGTKTGYNRGCRDECCTRANMVALKRFRLGLAPKLIDPTGTRRRIEALSALGWSYDEIGHAAGHSSGKGWVREVLVQPRVVETTADKVAEVYERWSMTEPPYTPQRARIRALAKRRGALPPLAWVNIDDPDEQPDLNARDDSVDEVVVLRVVGGDFTLQPNRAERYEIVRRWQGSDAELERRTGWNVPRMRREMNTTEEVA